MATVAVLPSTLRDKFAAAARRVRILRAVRGASLLVLTLLLFAAAAFAADAWLELPAAVRAGLLFAWMGVGASIGVFGLLLPPCRRIDREALAALVEQRYSDLGERLTSSVELSGESGRAHGSPALISLLIDETAARTGPLDFPDAIPARRTIRLAAVAVGVLLASSVVAVTMRGDFARLCGRFFFPDSEREAIAAYELTVTPGDAIAARGRPLTVTARLERTTDSAVLPRSASLVITDSNGQVTRLPMTVDGEEFAHRIDSLVADLCYRVESGKAVSPDYQITAVEPINVAADGLAISVTPPAYARNTFESESFAGFHDIAALQHSSVRLQVRFTLPAREALLFWPSDNKEAGTRAGGHPLALGSDCRSGTIELSALADGPYKLLLRGENGFDTELAGGELSVHVDQPPTVSKLASAADKGRPGSEGLAAVLPYDRVPLDVALADDVGIALAELEYRVNDGPVQREEITLQGRGTKRSQASHVFQLSGKVKEGDEIRYRLRIADNRDVPEAGLKPHVVYYPAERWLGLRIVGQTVPLAEQQIQAQRDEIDKRLEKIKKDLTREQRGVYKLRQETRNQPSLLPEQTQELKSLRADNESSREALEQLSRETAGTPELRDLPENLKEVADEELKRSEADLTDAVKEEQARQRQQHLNDADRQVTAALSKLEALRRVNDRLARERLDQAKLDTAAKHEEDLARRAEEVAAKDPVKDPTAKPQADQLQREQKKLADELDQAANQSEALKKALDAAREEQAKQLGEKARDLAKEERDLAKVNRDPELDKLAKKQRAIADEADKLAKKTRPTAQAAQTQPLKPDDARHAAEDLKKGDAAEALKHQDQAANEMQRLARDLDRAAEQARDPKEAARQLARLQKDLQQRLADETRKNNGQTPPAEAMKDLESEENTIAKAAQKLSVPPNDDMQKDRKEAADQASKAADAMRERDPRRANEKMEQSRQALKRLAERTPTLQQRQQEAAAEAERLRQKQDEVARQAEEAGKQAEKGDPQADKNRADASRKQAEIADHLGKMDAPMQEAQRDRAREAANQARKDLADYQAKASEASQQNAKEQLKKLSEALAGKPSANQSSSAQSGSPQGMPSKQQAAQASDLARQQRELRDEVRRLTDAATRADQTPQRKLQEQTGQLAKELDRLAQQSSSSPQVQQAARKAGDAAQQAQNAMQQAQNQARQGNQGQAQQSQQQAAQALDRAGQELAQAPGNNPSSSQQAGKDLQRAQEQMSQAQAQLGKGQTQSAQRSMQQAAKSLQQVAQQMALKPGTPKRDGQPNAFGAAPGGKPEEEGPALDAKKYAGKRWGELPGALQTKIIQDLKAKYGDDYSRIIKLYFEEIADTKGK
jgi:hypothetical protein